MGTGGTHYNHRVRPIVLAASIAILSGCSLFMRGVRDDWTPQTDPECQPYVIVPIIDALVGSAVLVWAATSACDEAASCLLGLAPGAVLTGSAAVGWFKVRRCDRAQKMFRAAAESAHSSPDDGGPEP
jgi:hypothetical protein